MSNLTAARLWQRVDLAERSLCLQVNRGCRRVVIRRVLALASRLGDGPLLYALMPVLAVAGGLIGTELTVTLLEFWPGWVPLAARASPASAGHHAFRSIHNVSVGFKTLQGGIGSLIPRRRCVRHRGCMAAAQP